MSERRSSASALRKRSADAKFVRGRTQWDAMTEVTSNGNWNATRMALLIFVRYAPRSAVGAALTDAALRLAELFAHHH
jgi:hypothetical protein